MSERSNFGSRIPWTFARTAVIAAAVFVLILHPVSGDDGAGVRSRVTWAEHLAGFIWWLAAILSVVVPPGIAAQLTLRWRKGSARRSDQSNSDRNSVSFPRLRRLWFVTIALWLALEATGAVWLALLPDTTTEPDSETPIASSQPPPLPHVLHPPPENTILVLVLGGSTAGGDPYAPVSNNMYGPGFSFLEAAAARLQKLYPDHDIQAVKFAFGGGTLRDACDLLARLNTKPGAIVIYSGHNEIFTRFRPDREVDPDALASREHRQRDRFPLPPSLLATCIERRMSTFGVAATAPDQRRRRLLDRPLCTQEESAAIYHQFAETLTHIVRFCRAESIEPILMIPACNESGFAPNRSWLTSASVENAGQRLQQIYEQLDDDSLTADERFELLLTAQQLAAEFAETNYRLGRHFESAGNTEQALLCYQKAIDGDGYPLRASSEIAEIYRRVASQFDARLIDARDVLRAISPNGIIGDDLMHDNCHPTVTGTAALATAVTQALLDLNVCGEPPAEAFEHITAAETVELFSISRDDFASVYEFISRDYSENLSLLRYDPADRLRRASGYLKAAERIRKGDWPTIEGVPRPPVIAVDGTPPMP